MQKRDFFTFCHFVKQMTVADALLWYTEYLNRFSAIEVFKELVGDYKTYNNTEILNLAYNMNKDTNWGIHKCKLYCQLHFTV